MPPSSLCAGVRFRCTFALGCALFASAALQNVTIDDADPAIAYTPPGAWSPGQTCSTCQAKPDAARAREGTWHDVAFDPSNPPAAPLSMSVSFEGSAVYVYCIVTRSSTDPFGNSDMRFMLDGAEVGQFVLAPDGDAPYMYDVPVYANASLAPGKHELTLVNGHAGGQFAIALFDYIVYSREADSSTAAPPAPATPTMQLPTASGAAASHHRTVAVAVSVSVAAVIGIGIALALYIRCHRRRHCASELEEPDKDSEDPPHTPSLPPETRVHTPSPRVVDSTGMLLAAGARVIGPDPEGRDAGEETVPEPPPSYRSHAQG